MSSSLKDNIPWLFFFVLLSTTSQIICLCKLLMRNRITMRMLRPGAVSSFFINSIPNGGTLKARLHICTIFNIYLCKFLASVQSCVYVMALQ